MPKLKPWYTLREYAALIGQTLTAVRRQADRGTLATIRLNDGKKSPRVVTLATFAAEKPDLYASLAMVAQHRRRTG